jgi:hypothetical protein
MPVDRGMYASESPAVPDIPSKAGGTRSGELSLRQQRMTMPMLETLRIETARVHLSLVRYSQSDVEEVVPLHPTGKYCPKPNEFVSLRLKATNMSRKYLASIVYRTSF